MALLLKNTGKRLKEYWEEVHTIQHRVNDYYVQLKSNLKENLAKKKTLIERAKELGALIPQDAKAWEAKTQQFKNLQEEWKKAGPVAKNISDEVWAEFRTHFDAFFDKRKALLATEKKKWKMNADAKQAIVYKAKALVENVAENGNPQLIKQLQGEWKKLATQAVLQNKNFGKSLDNNVTPSLIRKMWLKMNFLKKRKRI